MISVFVPCYNEEKRIEQNILSIYHALIKLNKQFELVIVDDGSTDKTTKIGKILDENYKHIKYQYYNDGPSRRENLGKAFRTAKGDVVVFMDLDLSVDLSYVPKLLKGIENGYDVVIGSRYKDVRAKRRFVRLVISTIYNKFMRFYLGSHIADHQCGFKAFKKDKLLVLLDEMGYDNQLIRGWFWDVELLIRAQRKNYKINEFPVAWKFGKQSSFDFIRELKMIPYVLKLRFRL